MPLTHDHYADVAVHWTIAGVAVMQTVGWLMVAEMAKPWRAGCYAGFRAVSLQPTCGDPLPGRDFRVALPEA